MAGSPPRVLTSRLFALSRRQARQNGRRAGKERVEIPSGVRRHRHFFLIGMYLGYWRWSGRGSETWGLICA